jgi:2-hydroxychromene-2-carboxylate isomerase
MPGHIDYYFSLSSPWSYLGHPIFARIVRENGLTVRYKPATLSRIFAATGGLVLGQRHEARKRYRMLELQRWRDKRQVPMKLHPKFWPLDPGLADRVILAVARANGPVEAVLPNAFKGVFENELDLADPGTLATLLADAGLDAKAILALADTPEVAAEYEQNIADAVAAGVVGAPGYVRDGEPFWGQDRLDLLEDAVKSGRPGYSPAA